MHTRKGLYLKIYTVLGENLQKNHHLKNREKINRLSILRLNSRNKSSSFKKLEQKLIV